MTEERRQGEFLTRELFQIKGIVGSGRTESKDKKSKNWSIIIADCMPNIRGIVKRARAAAAKYGYTIEEIELRPHYEYLLEEP